ncbi:hypothetical protein AF335_03930 [Streptomyces eurocidicus]|uniref:Uncharacterized protein n=1 Tax=Streptomyces eurocidicus TaxID=66423 RepID=A0A2N8P392_STREU|nr:hypothetical protein [Streptomyces eurocidicus]MBB5117675.1 hypothetical protein [Streptomyces eurocidicus]MBF6053512.1 hypothetical protein [Streptomyces eurocidicus]PNE35485.1 hypothetical protein AF335_03930 [Streptomyces eurocidicus]
MQHFHGYLWVGDKAVFDKESLRRPPPSVEPTVTSPPDVIDRYRQAVAEWRTTAVPPLETAYWLVKPPKLIQGTWDHPKKAAEWLGEQLAGYAPRFNSQSDQDTTRLAQTVSYAAQTLGWGGDISLGHYLGRPMFLSLAVATCSPNRTLPDQPCPTA